MKRFIPLLVLLLSCTLLHAVESAPSPAAPSATKALTPRPKPKPVRTPRFVKPPSPVIRVSTAVVNKTRLWQVEVVTGSLELQNFTKLYAGDSRVLREGDIVWKIGQIVEIATDDVWAGGKAWKAGTRLFVDERGKFLPITMKKTGASKTP